ncbi:unnamed protein product [Cochlearia groenlandica]
MHSRYLELLGAHWKQKESTRELKEGKGEEVEFPAITKPPVQTAGGDTEMRRLKIRGILYLEREEGVSKRERSIGVNDEER